MFVQLLLKVLQSTVLSSLILTCLRFIHVYKNWLDSFPRKHSLPPAEERRIRLTEEQREQIKEQLGADITEISPASLKRFFNVRRWAARIFRQPEQSIPEHQDRATAVMEYVERWGWSLMFFAYFVGKLILNIREWTKQ